MRICKRCLIVSFFLAFHPFLFMPYSLAMLTSENLGYHPIIGMLPLYVIFYPLAYMTSTLDHDHVGHTHIMNGDLINRIENRTEIRIGRRRRRRVELMGMHNWKKEGF